MLSGLSLCSFQCFGRLPLLPLLSAWTCRTGTDYAVGNNLITLPRFPVLSGPLADLHVTRHADKVAFFMSRQRVSLLTKCQD